MSTLALLYAQLEPAKIITNTKKQYTALYCDDDGTYEFSIKRKMGTYTVISDGVACHKGEDKNHIIWNFETQLAKVQHLVKVLQ